MRSSIHRFTLPRPRGLRGGIVVGLALAIAGAAVGTATGATTPFQLVIVKNTASEPVPVTGTISVGNTPSNQNVTVTNFPATQAVSGTVNVASLPNATVKFYGTAIGDGAFNIPFGKTINVTAIFVVDGTGDNYKLYLDTYPIVEEAENNYNVQFASPVPATGVQLDCLNLSLDCHLEVTVFGY
jgi:hypothetical protein